MTVLNRRINIGTYLKDMFSIDIHAFNSFLKYFSIIHNLTKYIHRFIKALYRHYIAVYPVSFLKI